MKEKSQKFENSKNKTIYFQKFRQEWKLDPLLRDWLCEDENLENRAFCRYCKCSLLSKYCDLLTHAKTNKHTKAALLYEENEDTIDFKPASKAMIKKMKRSYPTDDELTASTIKFKNISYKKKTKMETNPLSSQNTTEERECIEFDAIQSDVDEDALVEEIISDLDSEIHKGRSSPAMLRNLQAERIKAETEYYRQKSLYLSKQTENSRMQRTVMILQSRKLHLEVKKLQNELSKES